MRIATLFLVLAALAVGGCGPDRSERAANGAARSAATAEPTESDPDSESELAAIGIAEGPDKQFRVVPGDDSRGAGLGADEFVTPMSLDELVRTSIERGLIVATVESEAQGRTGEDLGEGFAALRDLTLSVERSFVGDHAIGSTVVWETDGWVTRPDGERIETSEVGCGRVRPGQRVLVGFVAGGLGSDGGLAASCYGWFILYDGQVVDTGRGAPFIEAAEQETEPDLLREIQRLVDES